MYKNIDDHPELEKVADLVTVNVKHTFTAEELDQEGQLLAQAVNDKTAEEINKKVAMAVFKNKIDSFDAEIKIHATQLANGFTYRDKSAEMFRDFGRAKRVYFDKNNGDFIKEEDFHHSDFQKQIDFESEEDKLKETDRLMQMQIEENNRTGDFAEGEGNDGPEMGYDKNGNLTDIQPFEVIDKVIVDKKLGIEPPDDDLPEDDMFKSEKK